MNGETVTLTQVRELASLLIDIHGQHEHQSLLHKKNHLQILDEYAKEKLAPYKEKGAHILQTMHRFVKNWKLPHWMKRPEKKKWIFYSLKWKRLTGRN